MNRHYANILYKVGDVSLFYECRWFASERGIRGKTVSLSGACYCAYVYASAGVCGSSTDTPITPELTPNDGGKI